MCLAHLDEPALNEALAALYPGSEIDLRGTPLTRALLYSRLEALTPGGAGAVAN